MNYQHTQHAQRTQHAQHVQHAQHLEKQHTRVGRLALQHEAGLCLGTGHVAGPCERDREEAAARQRCLAGLQLGNQAAQLRHLPLPPRCVQGWA